jgi:GT2 family glycosyltransferase
MDWSAARNNGVLPSLAVIIPSYNRADLLAQCLRTVVRHAPPGTDVLVVDDGSPQGQASSVAARFTGVRTIRRNHRRGFCAAINAGIRAVQASIVELLNDDTEVTTGWAESALARFLDPTVAAVAPLVFCKAPAGADTSQTCPAGSSEKKPLVDSAGDRYYIGGIAGKRGHRKPLDSMNLRPRRVFGASASSGFFRRDCLLEVGGFPESFGAYFEDVDLAFRLHWAGYQVLFEPASQVYHHVSASYGSPGRRLLEQQSRNEERVFWRNLPNRDLIRALPYHFAVLAAKARRRWERGELLPFVCGRLAILGEMSVLRRHRRWLQRLGSAASLKSWEVESSFWE